MGYRRGLTPEGGRRAVSARARPRVVSVSSRRATASTGRVCHTPAFPIRVCSPTSAWSILGEGPALMYRRRFTGLDPSDKRPAAVTLVRPRGPETNGVHAGSERRAGRTASPARSTEAVCRTATPRAHGAAPGRPRRFTDAARFAPGALRWGVGSRRVNLASPARFVPFLSARQLPGNTPRPTTPPQASALQERTMPIEKRLMREGGACVRAHPGPLGRIQGRRGHPAVRREGRGARSMPK
jgi:hypothetical protein